MGEAVNVSQFPAASSSGSGLLRVNVDDARSTWAELANLREE
jgi:hypothetical protein